MMRFSDIKFKRHKISLLAVIAVAVIAITTISCSKINIFSEKRTPYHYNILADIYRTMAFDADSALLMIEELGNNSELDKLTKAEFYEYHILLAEARYKCILPSVNESEIRQAVYYFDSLIKKHPNNNELLLLNSRANYYKGTIEDEQDNYKESLISYLEALKIIEKINGINRNREDIVKFKALTYVRIGDILYWLDSYDASIECLEKANTLFTSINHLNASARNHILLSIIYSHNFNYDKSFRHISIADSLIMEFDESSPLRHTTERINAALMYNIGYHDEPFKIMMRQYNTLTIPNLKKEAAAVLGDIYYSKGMLDSAIYYYEQYLPENKYSTIDVFNHLVEIGLKTSNNELIAKYGPILLEETNKELMLSAIKTDLSSLYKEYMIEIANEKEFKSIRAFLLIIIFISLSFIVIGLYILHFKKIIYRKEIDNKDFYINSLQEKIDKKNSENKHFKQKLNNLENELQYIKSKKYLTHAPFDLKLKELIESSSLCQELVKISQDTSIKTNVPYPDLILSEKVQEDLPKLFNDKFNNAFNKIIDKYKGLKDSDKIYFSFYLLGMEEKHISAVTGKSYNTIYNRTKRIQEILGSNDSIKDTIRDIIIEQ